jgi:tetratricopeptide (TPR) repeat protein
MYEGEAGNPVEGGTEERVERRIGEAYVARAGGMWALAEEKEVFGCFGGVVEPKGTSGGSVRSVTSDTSSGGGIYGAIMRDARLALECERISACKRTLTGGDEASGAVVRSKALCLLGYALLRRGIIEGISDAFEGCLDVAKTALKSADKKNSDELNKTINKAKDGLADLGRYEMLSTRLKKENRSRANIYLHDLSDVLKLSPASDKWNMEMIRFLSYQRRWYAVANYCERMAAKVLEVEGAFEGDLAEFHSTPGVSAEDLTVEFFEKKEEVPSYLRVVGDKAAGDVALRLPECLTPIYLRALRLEERFGAASCATSALIDVGGWRFDCANREMPILQKTVQLKEEADVLFRDGVFERAAGLYERCIMADNDSKESPGGKLHAVLHSNRASCFSSLGQHAEAIAECKAATDIHSMYMAAILRMARCYAKAGDTEKAKEVYSKWNMLVEKARRQPYPPVNAGPACFFDMPSEVKSHEWNAVKDEMKELGLTVISSSKRGLGGYSGRSGSFLSRITLKRSNRGQRSRSKGPVSRGFSLFKSGCCKKAESQVVRDQPVSKYSSSSNGGSARAFERHDSASSHSRKPSRRRTYSRSPSPPSPKSASSRDATRHDEPSIAWSNASSDANSIDAIRRDNAKRPYDPSTSRDANRHLDPSELDGSNARPDPPLSNPNMLRPKQNGFQNPLEPPIQIDTNVDYYDTLDLDKHASSSDIKKAYRRVSTHI